MKIEKTHKFSCKLIIRAAESIDAHSVTVTGRENHVWMLPIHFLQYEIEKTIEFLNSLTDESFYYSKITVDITKEPGCVLELCNLLIYYRNNFSKNTKLRLSRECQEMLTKIYPEKITELGKNFLMKEHLENLSSLQNAFYNVSTSKDLTSIEIKIYCYILGSCMSNSLKYGKNYIPLDYNYIASLFYKQFSQENKKLITKAIDRLIKRRLILKISDKSKNLYCYANFQGPINIGKL